MKVQLQSTTQTLTLNGVPARVWEGTTEAGIPVVAFISRVAVREGHDASEFERDLQECAPPTHDLGPIDMRLIL
jgi:hypothetical protein